MKKTIICLVLLIVCFGYVFAETVDESDYFSVKFEAVNHWGVNTSLDPDEVFQGDSIEYRVRVENVYLPATTQRHVRVQLTFPNMWVDPPETPQLYADFIGEGVAGYLPHGFSNTPTYATWTFDEIDYSAARTIICTLQVRGDICGSYPNDVNLTAFAQAWSDFSDPTKTADLSDGVVVKCRPGLTCEARISKVGETEGTEISVSSGDDMYIKLEGCNYPYNVVNANDCLFYILLPPDAIALYDYTEPTCDGIETIVGGSYDGWRIYRWNIDLAHETCETCSVFFQENDGTPNVSFYALGGVLWDADPSILWTGTPLEPIEDIVLNPPSSFICGETLRWSLTMPDLVISVESPYGDDCISCGWPVSFDWMVTNAGTGIANADPLIIEFTSDGALIGTETISDFSLSTGNSISGTVPIANPTCGDTIEFCAEVDANNVVEESDETNNSQYDDLCIGITEINVDIIEVQLTGDDVTDFCDVTYSAKCESMLAFISVTDQNGYPIRDLAHACWNDPYTEWSDLKKCEGGSWWNLRIIDPLRMFAADEDILPLSVAIVMDYSGSMDSSARALAEASVTNYVLDTLCAERFSIIKFGTDVEVKCDFSDDTAGIVLPAVNSDDYTGGTGSTNILGAINAALILIENDPVGFRHIVILFTDGEENVYQFTEVEITDLSRLLHVPLFTIGISVSSSSALFLSNLAMETGGLYRDVDSPDEMEPLYLFFCNAASYVYIMQFTSRWDGGLDTLTAMVELQNESTFGLLLSDSDTSEYETCSPECELTINKHSYGLPLDPLFGVLYAETSAVINYRISATNLGHAICSCDPVVITDYLPAWAGTVITSSISPTTPYSGGNSIVWEIEPDSIVFGSNYIIEFSFQVTDDADTLNNGPSPYIVNCVTIECGDDVDPTNNSDCDSVVVKLVPDPSIICEYLANSNQWPGDTAIISVSCPLPTQPENWDAWFESSCIEGSLPEPFANHAGQFLERTDLADTIIFPELAAGCDIGEIWVYVQVRHDFMDSTIFYMDSCSFNVRRPPCRVRIDKNQINTGDEVMIEITQCDASNVKVRVINISGDIVAEPLNESFGQGLFKFYWDGTDDMGHSVNSGVYGILVEAGDELYTFKLAVVR
ncbi:VWA domain-containing protein [bacterium]|nr:VWA domain-containing protein [bacterium]